MTTKPLHPMTGSFTASSRTLARIGTAAGVATIAALAFAPLSAQAVTAPVCSNGTCSITYSLTGAPQTFVVPAGVHALTATVAGGSGGIGHNVITQPSVDRVSEVAPPPTKTVPTPGGAGGEVVANVPVTPGESLTVVVGGKGSDADNAPVTDESITPSTKPGGYGGGGWAVDQGGSDGAGGGGSFIFRGASVVVASGGGGGGGYTAGGTGGAGGAGTDGGSANPSDLGGAGATTTAPGAGGTASGELSVNGVAGSGPASGPSTFGQGGQAAFTSGEDVELGFGGGGGGGVYGGGSGASNFFIGEGNGDVYGSGGGGSGALGAGVTALSRSTNVGDGSITLTWNEQVATTTSLTASPTTVTSGDSITLTADVSPSASGRAGLNRAALRSAAVVSGKVTFRRGSTVIGSSALKGGTATVTVKAGAAGTTRFTATYSGNAAFLGSTSSVTTVTVKAAAAVITPVGPSVNTGGTVIAPTSSQTAFIAGGLGSLGLLVGGASVVVVRSRRD